MDEPIDDDPIVVVDDDPTTDAPPRRRRWPWVVGAAAVLVLIGVAAVALMPRRSPVMPPAPVLVSEIAFAEPALPEPTPAPVESPVVEDPPEVQPPPPPPPPAPPKEEPKPIIVAEAPAHPPDETVAAAPAPLPPAPPPAPAPEETVNVEKEMTSASTAIRDAEPLFQEVADGIDAAAKGDPRTVAAKMDRIEHLLLRAQETYARMRNHSGDPETVEARMAVLDELLEALKEGRARIRVPLALKEAEALQHEAAPMAKEALDGFQPGSHEAQALDVKAEVAAEKLRAARARYLSIRNSAPDPKSVDRELKRLDAQLESIESRYPSMKAAH